MRRAILIAVLLIGLGAGWYFGSPLWTLSQIRKAAEAGDAKTVAAYVDFPALGRDVAGQLQERMRQREGGIESKLASGLLREALARGVASAGALEAFFAGEPALGRAARIEDFKIRYEGFDQFRLIRKDGKGPQLIFRRYGFGWKLAGMLLPSDFPRG